MKQPSSPMQKILNVYGIILIVWSVYRWKLQMPEWFDELVAKPLVFVLPVYWHIVRSEQKKFFDDIWLHTRSLSKDIAIGCAMGALFAGSAIAANIVRTGSFSLGGEFTATTFAWMCLLTLATATTEEILSRGFILKRFYEDSKNIYLASFNASILFLVLHVPILFTIPELRGSLLLMFLATDFILSLVNSFLFIERKSLLAPILVHAFYNLAILLYI